MGRQQRRGKLNIRTTGILARVVAKPGIDDIVATLTIRWAAPDAAGVPDTLASAGMLLGQVAVTLGALTVDCTAGTLTWAHLEQGWRATLVISVDAETACAAIPLLNGTEQKLTVRSLQKALFDV